MTDGVFEIASGIARENHEQRDTFYVSGASKRILVQLLKDQHRVYQGWMDARLGMCERETAVHRLIVLEDVLGQLGVEVGR